MKKKRSVALATSRELPEPDHDEKLLLEALDAAGVNASLLAWDEPGSVQSLRSVDLCILRSTWNYHLLQEEFRVWLRSAAAATALANPLPVVEWNLHKRYLLELEKIGIPIVPSVFLGRDTEADLDAILEDKGWGAIVIKPAVSAGSYLTHNFQADQGEQAQEFLSNLLSERDAMIQPFMDSVMTVGERCLVQIDGEWTHVIEKKPRFADGVESVSAGREPSEAEREFGTRVLSGLGARAQDLLYARVDMMPTDEGQLRLSELELIEPSLFLLQSEVALERLVRAVVARLG